MSIEAMKLALEALNRSDYLGWQCNIPVMKELRAAIEQATQLQPDLAKVGEVGVWGDRQWQGLTDEEAWDIYCEATEQSEQGWLWNARAIEAKLKEKNNG